MSGVSLLVNVQSVSVGFIRGAQWDMICLGGVGIAWMTTGRQVHPLFFSYVDHRTAVVGDHMCGYSAEEAVRPPAMIRLLELLGRRCLASVRQPVFVLRHVLVEARLRQSVPSNSKSWKPGFTYSAPVHNCQRKPPEVDRVYSELTWRGLRSRCEKSPMKY
eukprot:67041-Pyramimonas_sp.AAC.1